MPLTRIQFLTQIRAALKNPIGSGSALLVALACSTGAGEERTDVRTAFKDVAEDVPAPPSQPGPAVSRTNNHSESIPAPDAESHVSHRPHHVEHCCPQPAYTRWPVIGPLHRRWITYTKPHMQASHWGYPEYFEERPYGSYVLQAEQMQIVNGLRDQQVLYNYDFYTGDRAAELTPRGQYQLRKIIRRIEIVPCPIVVQIADPNNPNPELDEARRQTVIAALESAGVPAASDLVIADRPSLPGLQGVEAISIYGNLIGQTQDRGGGFDYRDDFTGGAPNTIFIGSGIGFGAAAPQ